MAKYKCIKPIPKSEVKKDSIWEYEHDYKSTSDARLYLEGVGDDDGGYIDITFEEMEEHFIKVSE